MKRDTLCRIGAGITAALFVAFWLWDPQFSADETAQFLAKSSVSRLLGSVVFVFVLLYLGYRVLHRPRWRHFGTVFPALLIAVNNFPIIGLIRGWVWVERWELLWLFLVDALLIGLFEEMAFRGVLLPVLLEKRRGSKRQIFFTTVVSSAVFGLVHLVNLAEGAGIGGTVLQVGYSFLIGGMCAIVFLKTGNLIYCVLLHGIYDVGGGLISMIGGGSLWDTPTVILTVIVSVVVILWMLRILQTVTTEDVDRLYHKKGETT